MRFLSKNCAMKLKVNNRVQGTKFLAGGYGRQSLPIK